MKLLALSLAVFVPMAFGAESAAALQKKFLGSWKLISMEGPNQRTDVKRVGIISYDHTGHMSVQIWTGERPGFANGRAKATDREKAAAFESYIAYFGTYKIESENGVVVHHLEGSLGPGQVGNDNIRYFEFKGDRLILSVGNDGRGGRLARKDTTAHITWEKLPVVK